MTRNPPPPPDAASLWQEATALADAAVRARVAALVDAHADSLSALFYDRMMVHPQAGRMLDHQLVNQRLHASMARWCRSLFRTDTPLADLQALQQRTGEVHARIGVPMTLVSNGARLLKRAICSHLARSDLARPQLADAFAYVHERIDVAVDAMHAAFDASTHRLTRSDEAYRLFFLGRNMKAERERRRSELLEWAHEILLRYHWDDPQGGDRDPAHDFSRSQFGLWLHHKAAMLFEGAPEVERIQALTQHIEGTLLPQLGQARGNPAAARSAVAALGQDIDAIKTLLGTMFDRFIEVEDGRDSVTRLLNRRYFPSVAKREIALAMRARTGFALLMVDIDHFATISRTVGQEAGDLVLAQVAELLSDSVRAGDFVFRVGDDQFLVLLVEAVGDTPLAVADGLRSRIAGLPLRTGGPAGTSVTVSIGVALFDGHPDYQRLVDRAEQALRQAKQDGRNRCRLAGPGEMPPGPVSTSAG
jgi:diguanylate cyclase